MSLGVNTAGEEIYSSCLRYHMTFRSQRITHTQKSGICTHPVHLHPELGQNILTSHDATIASTRTVAASGAARNRPQNTVP